MGPLHYHAACRHWSSLIARCVLGIALFGGQGVENPPEDFHNKLMETMTGNGAVTVYIFMRLAGIGPL